ncbi:MAG: lipoyl(octanoyl) transferase LipB [Rhodobacteraceae bacterium]|nr:MAG: lipoyl(octanoyl) transferase LipB [Paracoccaceae bacterium]
MPPEPEWVVSPGLTPYREAEAAMAERAALIRAGRAPEQVWLVEHPPLYTAGASADRADLLAPDRFPVFETRRGGQFTYHGPGQRVVYAMLDLDRRGRDVRRFVWALEAWIIRALDRFGVRGERRAGRVGVWVARPERPPGPDGAVHEAKIAAVGVKLSRWVSTHGFAINVDPDLSHFEGIVPCGLAGHGVTSLVDLGIPATMPDVDLALAEAFPEAFAAAVDGAAGR